MANAYKEKQIEGLDVFAVLGEDASGGEPSLEYCSQYADSAGWDPAKVLIDLSWTDLFQAMASGGSGGIGLPWDGVLDGRGMVYVYNPTVSGSPSAVVDELLAKD